MIELNINEEINPIPIDMSDIQQPIPSSSEPTPQIMEEVEKQEEFIEPDIKKRKLSSRIAGDEKKYKLEDRLGGILCCAVCLDLPRAAVYQVSLTFFHFVTKYTILITTLT